MFTDMHIFLLLLFQILILIDICCNWISCPPSSASFPCFKHKIIWTISVLKSMIWLFYPHLINLYFYQKGKKRHWKKNIYISWDSTRIVFLRVNAHATTVTVEFLWRSTEKKNEEKTPKTTTTNVEAVVGNTIQWITCNATICHTRTIMLNPYERNTLSFWRRRRRVCVCVCACCSACLYICEKMRIYTIIKCIVCVCIYEWRKPQKVWAKRTEIHTHARTHIHTKPHTHIHLKVWIASRSWNLWIPGKANPEPNIGMLFVCLFVCLFLILYYVRYDWIQYIYMRSPNGRVFRRAPLESHQFAQISFAQF